MSAQQPVDTLDYQTSLLILSYLTQELLQELPPEERAIIQSSGEARNAILAFLHTTGVPTYQLESREFLAEDEELEQQSIDTLKLLLNDEAVKPKAEKLVETPPEEAQMSVEIAVAGTIILATLVTWLQTKVSLKVSREKGITSFKFEIKKDSMNAEGIKDIAQKIIALLISVH